MVRDSNLRLFSRLIGCSLHSEGAVALLLFVEVDIRRTGPECFLFPQVCWGKWCDPSDMFKRVDY